MPTESISASTSQTLTFETKAWTIHLDPATLATHTTLANGRHIRISDPAIQPATIQNLQQKPTSASWEIPHIPLTVICRLEDTAFSVHFQTDSTGTFTWPILDNTSNIQAYILPLFEGSYVPANDDRWIQLLTRRSPLNTTESLSMPFWGLDLKDRTLTYILTNPFNNRLDFSDQHDEPALQFTHTFGTNWTVKEYGVRIHLGDASPIEPARQYRRWLIQTNQFVSLKDKIEKQRQEK